MKEKHTRDNAEKHDKSAAAKAAHETEKKPAAPAAGSAKASGPEEKSVAPEKPADKAGEKAAEADQAPQTECEDSGLETKLAELEKKLAEAEKQRLLALAEMDNQRKRFSKELEALRYRVTQDTLFPFLQVMDHFSMAVKAAEAPGANTEVILKGMEMIANEFDHAFTDLGVEKIDAAGKPFDPNFHEAVAEEPSDTVPAGVVIRQWSMGCKMGSRLLKPAMVVVSSGPAAASAEAEGEKDSGEDR